MTDTTQPAQSWVSDSTYQALRNQLLLANEGNRSRLYFDTRGIPTIGDGIALVVKNNLLNKWVVDTGAVGALGGGISTSDRTNLQQAADILNGTRSDEPLYGTKKTLTCFELSTRGTLTEMQFGTLDSRWQPSGWNLQPDAAAMQRLRIYKAAERENRLDALFDKSGLPDISLTASQRAGLLSMVWQGRENAAIAAARAIKAGESSQQICSAAADASTGVTVGRFNAECSALTDGEVPQYYQPRTTKPLLKSDLDGIVNEAVPLSSTMVAGGTAATDAEALANAQKRQALKATLSELADNYEGEVLGVAVTDGGLLLFNDNVTLEARLDGSSIAAETSGLVTIAHTVDGKRLTITWVESPEGGWEANTVLVDGQKISGKPALAALDGYGDELESVAYGDADALLAQIAAGNTTLSQTDAVSSVTTTLDATDHLVQTVERTVSGHLVKVEFIEDEWGDLKASRVVSVDGQTPLNPGSYANALNTQGYSPWDFADGQTPTGGSSVENIYTSYDPMSPATLDVNTLSAWLNLIQAIRNGQPLPIISSSVNLVSVLNPQDIPLAGASAALGSLSSLLALQKTLENHDLFGTVNASAQIVSYGAQLIAAANGKTLADALAANVFGDATGFVQGVAEYAPYLNIANAIVKGDAKSAILAIAYKIHPVAGLVLTVLDMLGVFGRDDPVPPSGTGYFYTNPDGSLGMIVQGVSGGEDSVSHVLNQLKTGIEAIIADAGGNNPATPLVVIASRLTKLVLNDGNFYLSIADPKTRAYLTLSYDGRGNCTSAPVGSDEYFRNLGEQFIFSALSREAIALPWEADTAQRQRLAAQAAVGPGFDLPWSFWSDYRFSGMTELQRSDGLGKLAPAGVPPSFKPILLDLNGDGVINLLGKKAVAFDVDDSGYLRNTAWAGKNASGKADGFLVLDRNHNARADTGSELFSNAQVADELKGVASLRWVDADRDGIIDRKDPVFNHLWVWQDNLRRKEAADEHLYFCERIAA